MAATIRYAGANLYPKQRDAIFDLARISIIEASTKSGKLAPLDSVVYTPTGPRLMGELRVGDMVVCPDGTRAPVAAIFPQGEQDVYRVHFSDGGSTECGLEHLWEIFADRRDYRRGYYHRLQDGSAPPRRKDHHPWPRVMTLGELLRFSEKRRRRMWVRVTKEVDFDATPVPIAPYAFGALLGDGSFRDNLSLTSIDQEIVARVRAEIAPLAALTTRDEKTHLIQAAKALRKEIRNLGLDGHYSYEKFIPDVYRYNTAAVRWAIVQGLMDTDGWVDQKGQPVLEITAPRLAEDFAEIVRSLGGLVRITTKRGSYRDKAGERVECKMVYRCRVTHAAAHRFFTLPRKLARCRTKTKPMTRTIRNIEFSRRTQTQCISVAHPDALYLADDLIVTHNTVGCLAWLLEQALTGKAERNYWWCSPVFGQAEIGFRRMCAKLPKSYYTKNQSKLTIKLANGTAIWFKSAERPDDLYGEDVYAAVLDEASRMREEAWHAVRSTLTATRGPVRIIGNVKGRKNWFYRLARAAETGAEGMAFHRITAWDAVEAGVLARDEIEASYRDFKRLGREGAWNQLYMAEAADDGDNPFGLAAIALCTLDGLETTREGGNSTWALPNAEWPKAAGVDLAGRGAANLNQAAADETTDRDYTAIVLLDADGTTTHLSRFRKGHTDTAAEVARVVKRVQALVDSTGTGDAVVEALQRRGDMAVEGYTFTERSRQDLLEGLSLAIGEQTVRFPDGWLRDELDSFEFRYTSRGVRYAVPEGMHDDGVMALALALKKLPWRRRYVAAPVGVAKAGGSTWTGNGSGSGAVDPLLSPPGAGAPAENAIPMPISVVGSGAGKWSGAGR